MRRCRIAAVALLPLLAGCGSAGHWTKPGADSVAAAAAYEECRSAAHAAVEPQDRIDQDIRATRQNDWQRAGIGRVESRAMREQSRDRVASIVDSCMQAKGFAKPR